MNELWAFFCILSFWGWSLATIGFIVKAFPTTGVFRHRPAFIWGGGVLLFYSLWIVSMVNT